MQLPGTACGIRKSALGDLCSRVTLASGRTMILAQWLCCFGRRRPGVHENRYVGQGQCYSLAQVRMRSTSAASPFHLRSPFWRAAGPGPGPGRLSRTCKLLVYRVRRRPSTSALLSILIIRQLPSRIQEFQDLSLRALLLCQASLSLAHPSPGRRLPWNEPWTPLNRDTELCIHKNRTQHTRPKQR